MAEKYKKGNPDINFKPVPINQSFQENKTDSGYSGIGLDFIKGLDGSLRIQGSITKDINFRKALEKVLNLKEGSITGDLFDFTVPANDFTTQNKVKKIVEDSTGKPMVPISELPDEYKQLRMAMVQGANPNAQINLPQGTDTESSFLGAILKGFGEGALNVAGKKLSSVVGEQEFDTEIVPQLQKTYGLKFQKTPQELLDKRTQLEADRDRMKTEDTTGVINFLGLRKTFQDASNKQLADVNAQLQPYENPSQGMYQSSGFTPQEQSALDYAKSLGFIQNMIRLQGMKDENEIRKNYLQFAQQASINPETQTSVLGQVTSLLGSVPANNPTGQVVSQVR